MSKIINFQEYKTIFKLSKYIENLLNDNYVINHIRKNNAGIENIKLQNSYLQAQFEKVFNSNSYKITIFNIYGKKIKENLYTNKVDFKKAFLKYSNGKLHSLKSNKFGKIKSKYQIELYEDEILSYHKKRVSKKITSNTFVSNEEDLKMEVYKMLLKQDKEAIIIPEYSINNSRADYVSFNKNKIDTTIIEIKSSLDNFSRLEKQIKDYYTIANKIYLAIDIELYNKLKKSKIVVPNYIGIFVFDNNKKQKLYKLNEAIYIKHDNDFQFIKSLSYTNIVEAFNGFKFSSKLSFDDKKKYMNNFIDKNILNNFAYKIVCNRYLFESERRKSLYYKGDFKLALASSKDLSINRFNHNNTTKLNFSDYDINKNALFDYYTNEKNKFLKEFNKINDFQKILKNKISLNKLIKFLQSKNIIVKGLAYNFSTNDSYKVVNELLFLESISKNKNIVLEYFN